MLKPTLAAALLTPAALLAESLERPVPQPQSATAEFWYLMASLALIAALWAAHMLVSRR